MGAGGARRVPHARVAVWLAAAAMLLACETERRRDREAEQASHDRMVALLAELSAEAQQSSSLLSDTNLRRLRGELASLPASSSPRQVLPRRLQLGESELRRGNLEAGIELVHDTHQELRQLHAAGKVRAKAVVETAYRLGVAYMRLGETENCCLRNAPESCILPIRGGGIHTKQQGSRLAIEQFERVLEGAPPGSPIYLKARWLINIAYMTIDGYPQDVPPEYLISPEALASDQEFLHFTNVAPRLGVNSFNLLGGALVDDFDNDGYLDIVASTFDPTESIRFFRNKGDGTFVETTEEANLSGILGAFNMIQADYDNDGDLDIYVTRGAWWEEAGRIPNSLLRNDGTGRFMDVTWLAGLYYSRYPSQTAAFADYDNDGDLDIYVGNETTPAFEAPSELLRNNGDGTFTDVAAAAGVENLRFAKSVGWGDYDEDGDPDLYVSNQGQENRLYRNNGDGTFTDVARRLGVVRPRMGFAAWFWDYDNDGVLDLSVSAYDWIEGNLVALVASTLGMPHPQELPRLYRGDGHGGFDDVTRDVGLDRPTLPMGANFGDLDNDGWLDFYLGTGYPDYEGLMPNVMYRNREGAGFADVTIAGGFGHLQKGHAIAFADIDHDGDQDVFEQMGGFFTGDKFGDALFENPGFGNRWIAIELEGRRSNRSAIGARIRVDVVERGASRSIYKHVNAGGSFGGNPLRQTIGLGRAGRVERLEVFWPTSGITQVFEHPPTERLLRVVEGEEAFEVVELKPFRLGA